MPNLAAMGALLQCTFGAAPAPLIVVPPTTTACGTPAGTIMDFTPANFTPFGLCLSPTNPVTIPVLALTGAIPPVPCTPLVAAPWTPGSPTVTIGGFPALNTASTAVCAYAAGMISFVPVPTTVTVP